MMIRLTMVLAAALTALTLIPGVSLAYDPAPDQALITSLNERIDGDFRASLLPADRAALLRAEIIAAQTLVTNGDSGATAMLADIDQDLSPFDKLVGRWEADRDLLFHLGDTITIGLRDGGQWIVEKNSHPDVMDVRSPMAIEVPGVQGVYLAKSPGFTAITLRDTASGRIVRFRFYIVDKAMPAS